MDLSTVNLHLLNNNKTTPLQPSIPSTPIPITTAAAAGSNGYLKRHAPPLPPAVPVSYKECLKNHAATSGGHALDGCGEFMPSPSSTLNCAACGCHRNFHRREPDDHPLLLQQQQPSVQHVIEYQPHHRHHPPPPIGGGGGGHNNNNNSSSSPDSTSPPPISSSYYPSAPHMLLALSSGGGGRAPETIRGIRKRFRTKFRQDQKDKMQEFAEKLGWKMQKADEEIISEFCTNVGVEKNVLKVWMHNNKNTSNNSMNSNNSNSSKENGDHPQPLMMMMAAADDAAANNNNINNGSSSSS